MYKVRIIKIYHDGDTEHIVTGTKEECIQAAGVAWDLAEEDNHYEMFDTYDLTIEWTDPEGNTQIFY